MGTCRRRRNDCWHVGERSGSSQEYAYWDGGSPRHEPQEELSLDLGSDEGLSRRPRLECLTVRSLDP